MTTTPHIEGHPPERALRDTHPNKRTLRDTHPNASEADEVPLGDTHRGNRPVRWVSSAGLVKRVSSGGFSARLIKWVSSVGSYTPMPPASRSGRAMTAHGGRRTHHGRAVIGALALVLLQPATSRAHLGHTVQQAERYLKLDVSGYKVRLVVSLTLGARETARLMEQADRNRDGWVSPQERDEHMAQWGDGLRDELRVSVDGRAVDVTYGEAFMQPIGEIVATEGSVEMVGVFDLDGGEQVVVVEDRMPMQGFERTDFSFRARDGATLVASGIGDSPAEAVEHISIHRGAPYPAACSMRVQVPPRPLTAQERFMSLLPWGAPLLAAVMLALAAALVRRRGRRPPPRPSSTS